jgi:hypothetical protein
VGGEEYRNAHAHLTKVSREINLPKWMVLSVWKIQRVEGKGGEIFPQFTS